MTAPYVPPVQSLLTLLKGGRVPGVVPDALRVVPQDPKLAFLSLVAAARQQMATKGITQDQREAYKGRLSDAIYQAFPPTNYPTGTLKDVVKEYVPAVAKQLVHPSPREQITRELSPGDARSTIPAFAQSEDLWHLFLGLPQRYGTVGVSNYKPSESSDNKVYLALDPKTIPLDARSIKSIVLNKDRIKGNRRTTGDYYPLGNYQWSSGRDEQGPYVAYYDKYDFDVPLANQIGKPIEIYDRIHYDPKTFEPIYPQGSATSAQVTRGTSIP